MKPIYVYNLFIIKIIFFCSTLKQTDIIFRKRIRMSYDIQVNYTNMLHHRCALILQTHNEHL